MTNLNASNLKNKVEVWNKVKIKNKLGEDDYEYQKIKDPLWCNIIPQNISGSTTATQEGNKESYVNQRIRCRKKSLTPTKTMYFIYKGLRYDVDFFQPDYKNDDFWEIMCKIRME